MGIVSESGLAPYIKPEEKDSFSTLLESTENWLYEDGFDAVKSVYAEKLADLKKHGNPIEQRQREHAGRPAALSSLQKKIESYQQWLNESTGQEEYAHITDEERQTCHAKCDETSTWMYETMDKLGSCATNETPSVTCAEIVAKNQELTKVCSGVKHKPKPKPKKKEPEPAPAKEEKKEEEPVPMETDEKPKEGEASAPAPEPMETEEV